MEMLKWLKGVAWAVVFFTGFSPGEVKCSFPDTLRVLPRKLQFFIPEK
jgi:hypothetical protein